MNTQAKIVSSAEAFVRTGGYNGFSFRDIARETGLTNAGVHHHFPTKDTLVAKVARNYTERFVQQLDAVPPQARPARVTELFAQSVTEDGKMCLCGMLATQGASLPQSVADAAKDFFARLVESLCPAFADDLDPETRALLLLAQLEGAVLLHTIGADQGRFETIMNALTQEQKENVLLPRDAD